MIVVMQPVLVGSGAFGLRAVGLRIGPFGGQGAVESLDFAVGLWPVGPGPLVGDVGAERFSEIL